MEGKSNLENSLFGLQDSHVIITGASGGIGLAAVKLFLSLGAHVSAQGNSSMKNLDEINDTRLFRGKADVTNEEEVQQFCRAAVSHHKRAPDILVGSFSV
jgi:NAD(P)-dependent dehydrogenase (short-subunit alcohol dehydrogenase family)